MTTLLITGRFHWANGWCRGVLKMPVQDALRQDLVKIWNFTLDRNFLSASIGRRWSKDEVVVLDYEYEMTYAQVRQIMTRIDDLAPEDTPERLLERWSE